MGGLSTYNLKAPLGEKDVTQLKVGDTVYLSGDIFTMRDRAHTRALEIGAPVDLKGAVIYHCGPLMGDKKVISAGPTTSSRMNKATPKMIEKFGISALIGKGGMDEAVLESMRGRCVYLSFTGGCGVIAAKAMTFKEVFWRDLGDPEALWVLEANNFGPLVVSMDSHGNSTYRNIGQRAEKAFELLEK